MAWVLEYRTNGADDTIILVNDVTSVVRSCWDATAKTVSAFADCTISADEWDGHFLDGHRSEDFGKLVATRDKHNLTVLNAIQWKRVVGVARHSRSHAKTLS